MKNLDRIPPAAYTAALGLSILLISAALWKTNDVLAESDPDEGARAVARAPEDSVAAPSPAPAPAAKKAAPLTPAKATVKWPAEARATARLMIAKYGQPNRVAEEALVWMGNGPWRKTVVYRSPWPRLIGPRGKEYLEQTVAYKVPVEKVDELKRFDQRIRVNQPQGLLSSRAESEPLNFLALNLADEIVVNKRTVEDAREFYEKTAKLAEAGKSSLYLSGLLFPGKDEKTPEPDAIDREMAP